MYKTLFLFERILVGRRKYDDLLRGGIVMMVYLDSMSTRQPQELRAGNQTDFLGSGEKCETKCIPKLTNNLYIFTAYRISLMIVTSFCYDKVRLVSHFTWRIFGHFEHWMNK